MRLTFRDYISLSQYTTFRIGGPARFLAMAKSGEDVLQLIDIANKNNVDWLVIGSGSNVLARDSSVDKAIIVYRTTENPRHVDDTVIEVLAGYPLHLLVEHAVCAGLGGLEKLAGIPGTVGGAVAGNAGAYGRSIGDVVASVKVADKLGNVKEISRDELCFGYRTSAIKDTGSAILSAKIKLSHDDVDFLKNEAAMTIIDRRAKHPDPDSTPTAGSFFKNPVPGNNEKVPAGKLLDDAGCRGLRVGNATTWPRHSNIIITDGPSTAKDVLALSDGMSRIVKEKFGVVLEREVLFLE